ncbi:hypothetical protein Tco_0406897 [Tanacetum coccineum]
MDDAGEDVVHNDDQPQDHFKPKITKTLNPYWFTQPSRPLTPDPEWNKRQYLKSSDPEITYTTSIMRTKAARYEIEEGDFVDLYVNDIEDMLLLAIQHKVFHLTESDIVDFIMALCMFTRSLVIKKRVEDLQLGVESYQKKLNINPPQQTFPKIEFKELYTPSHKPPGVIYEDRTGRDDIK